MPPDELNRIFPPKELQALGGYFLAYIGLFVVIQILVYWGVSRIVMPRVGTLWNAVRNYCFTFAGTIIVCLGWLLVGLIGMMVLWHGRAGEMPSTPLIMGWFLLYVAAILSVLVIVTMKVYQAGVGEAVIFHVMAWVVLMVINVTLLLVPAVRAHTPLARIDEITRGIVERAKEAEARQKEAAAHATPAGVTRVPARPTPPSDELRLTAPVQIPVVIGGANSGEVTLSPGTVVKLISVEGDQARIQYMDSVATIPLRSTDYGQTQTPAPLPARTP